MRPGPPRIGVIVVAYNAASTLAGVLDRIPVSFVPRISEVLVCDDHSQDSTYLVGLGYQQLATDLPVTVIRHPRNLGYGGNQKAAYRRAEEHGLDIVVLLHGDGQYAPELLPELVEPICLGQADAVFGSRMMEPGAARRGGMPMYKYVGNRVLSAFENRMLGVSLSEFHSGYRAYRVSALRDLPVEHNSDGFDFDTQIIIQLVDAGKRIMEIPIPTYYGDEICYVNGVRYARDISAEVARYRLGKLGFGRGPRCLAGADEEPYSFKPSPGSSHALILDWLSRRPPCRVLDLGCSSGLLAARSRELGHYVCGVDVAAPDGVEERVDRFVQADLDDGVPASVGDAYDVVVAADVLEHVRRPERVLEELRTRLTPDGVVLACVPNFGHWYPRTRTALGMFDYDQRGILDRGHVRFFTRRSVQRLIDDCGYRARRWTVTGLPVDAVGVGQGRSARALMAIDRTAAWLRPQIFAYQFLIELEPRRQPPEEVSDIAGAGRTAAAAS
jgi:glycosyltransferase involved in cell wall biosynthesis